MSNNDNQLPVYVYKENYSKPLSTDQLNNIVNNPSTIIIDGITGNTLNAPPVRGDLRPDGQRYHVANYIPQLNELVYHGYGV